MPTGSAGRRYAQAVFEVAKASNQLDEWAKDLETIQQVLETPDISRRLENPKLTRENKISLLNGILKDEVSQPAFNLATLLVNRSRYMYIGAIATEYKLLVNQLRGIAVAEVTTAVPIDEAEEALIRQKLSEITGKQIVITKKVDPSIIGGLVARVGDTLIDGSVTSRLQTLRKTLA
jgi:F-type H+-transporting ATPase subunit delta